MRLFIYSSSDCFYLNNRWKIDVEEKEYSRIIKWRPNMTYRRKLPRNSSFSPPKPSLIKAKKIESGSEYATSMVDTTQLKPNPNTNSWNSGRPNLCPLISTTTEKSSRRKPYQPISTQLSCYSLTLLSSGTSQ